jgi:hypothetical protein
MKSNWSMLVWGKQMLFVGRMVLNTYKTMGVKVYAFYYWNMKQKLQYPAFAGPRGCWMSSHPRYWNDICKVYLCVPSNIMNRPKHFSMNVLSHFVAAVQVPSRHSLDTGSTKNVWSKLQEVHLHHMNMSSEA